MLRLAALITALFMVTAASTAEDRLIQVYLDDKGQGQKCRLWLPEGVDVLRGVIIDLGNPHGGDRPDFQAFARANRYACLGTLLRWPATLKDDLVKIMADLAVRSAHPELVNVPWIMTGFSRSVPQCAKVAISAPELVLAVLAGGSQANSTTPEAQATWKQVPVMNVNGSHDPYIHTPEGVSELRWFTKDWLGVRERKVPWGAAIQWGAAHTPGTGFVIQAAFLKDQLAARLPADWDPRKGPPTLKDGVAEADGWLGDVATWSTAYPVIAKQSEFTGDARTALWMPGSYSAAVWRAYVVKDPAFAITVADGQARIEGAVPAGMTKVAWFDGDQQLGTTDPATPLKLPPGLRCLFAEAMIGTQRAVSRPLLVLDGVAIPLGEEPMRDTHAPLALIQLDPEPKQAITALLQRATYSGPSRWKPVYRSDFSADIKPWTPGRLAGEATAVEGALQISSPGQFLTALPYDWPSEVAVEYRCRSIGEKPNDIGLMLDGIDQGERPWRDGVMFHFGEGGNSRSSFQVIGEPGRNYDLRFVPGQWHALRVERVGNQLAATIDGKPAGEPEVLSESNLAGIKGHRIGFYTVANTAQIRDVVISVREPVDPAAVQPALPSAAHLAGLAKALIALVDFPYAEQRNLANEYLARLAVELAPALRDLATAGASGPKGRVRIEQLLANLRPQ